MLTGILSVNRLTLVSALLTNNAMVANLTAWYVEHNGSDPSVAQCDTYNVNHRTGTGTRHRILEVVHMSSSAMSLKISM